MRKSLKHKGRKILKARSTFQFPEYDIIDYQLSLINQLNYYNLEVDPKMKQQWAISNWKKQGKSVSKFASVKPEYFSQVGALVHMLYERNLTISKKHMDYIDQRYKEIAEMAAGVKDDLPKVEKPKEDQVSIQDRINATASTHIGEIEGFVDDFVWGGKQVKIYNYLSSNYVKPLIAKRIRSHFAEKLKDVESDATFTERGYTKKTFKSLKHILEQVIADCSKLETIGKMVVTRKVKKVIPAKVVSKLKYMKYYEPLLMSSVSPEKILDATELWLYDTSNRRIHRYEALEGSFLTVKNSSVMNWNPDTSGSKIMRKPEVQLKDSSAMGKRVINKLFNDTNAILGKVTGRINDKQIILKVF
jgi:hypothetical protein